MSIAAFVLQAVGTLIVVMVFVIAQAQAVKARQQKIHDALEKRIQADLTRVRCELDAEKSARTTNINRLHERIDETQKELIKSLQDQMSRMEGELKGVTNILSQIQGWFINQAKPG